MSRRSAKRHRAVGLPSFGGPSEADLPAAQQNTPSSSALSTRSLPAAGVPALTSLCARVFVANISRLSQDPVSSVWRTTRRCLKILPEHLLPKVFAMLRASYPEDLTDSFITAFFLRGPSITLTSSLPSVKERTVFAIKSVGPALRELELIGFGKYSDSLFASLISELPSLRVLVLRGCTRVGPKTAASVANSCHHLTSINLGYTTATPSCLASLLTSCTELEVLKLAGIPNWTDATFSKFTSAMVQHDDHKLMNLKTLKLRELGLTDGSLKYLISLFPNLKRLDLSFSSIRRLSSLNIPSLVPNLEKLSLTSTRVASAEMLTVISQLPQLKTLSLGALGGGQASNAAMGNSSAMTMSDDVLTALTDILKNFTQLENVNLVSNTKLGFTARGEGAIADFISRVGRKCKKLDMACLPHLRSLDLAGLLPATADQGHSCLETLILDNTGIDDTAAVFISSCPMLQTLEVAGTKVTNDGLFTIIDSCSSLVKLNLTSCRGIKVVDRRRFFEIWRQAREIV